MKKREIHSLYSIKNHKKSWRDQLLSTRLMLFAMLMFNFSLIGMSSITITPIDTIIIPTVTITEQFNPYQQKYFNKQDSGAALNAYMPDAGAFLNKMTPLFLRSYGPGLIYSISVRGGNSAQAAVLWNGIKINTVMQGQSDVSLIGQGGGQALYFYPNSYTHGLSGSLVLQDEFNEQNRSSIHISEQLNSLFGHRLNGDLFYAGKKLKSGVHLLVENTKNSFSILKNGNITRQTNAAIDQYQLKWKSKLNISPSQSTGAYVWLTRARREIPASLYEKESDAIQLDRSVKLMVNYNYFRSERSVKLQSAYIMDNLIYNNALKNIFSNSRSHKFVEQFLFKQDFKQKGILHFQLENELNLVYSDAYKNTKRINYLTITANHNFSLKSKHHLIAGIKTGLANRDLSPIAPFLRYRYLHNQTFQIFFSTGKKYRYPSFNDYFWFAGGNADLLPEISLESELGFQLSALGVIEFQAQYYFKDIKNWIIWLPENGIFKAQNIDRVLSHGMESSLRIKKSFYGTKMDFRMLYNYNRTFQVDNDPFKRQLIYTPQHLIKNNIQVSKSSWQFQLVQSWTGRVFTATDHSYSLAPYYLMDISIVYRNKHSRFSAAISNLLNTTYQNITNYPMPGRVYHIGITYKIQLKK